MYYANIINISIVSGFFQFSCRVYRTLVFSLCLHLHTCVQQGCPLPADVLYFCYNGLKGQLEKWECDTRTAKYQESMTGRVLVSHH